MTPSGRLAGGRPTPQPSGGGNARQVPDPADGAPRRRRGVPAGDVLPDASGRPAPVAPVAGAGPSSSPAAASQLPSTVAAGDPNPAGVPTPRAGGTPAGSTRLSGAEALKAIQQAQAKARRGPAVRKPAARTTAAPVAPSGASLTATATCLAGCGWTAGPGDPGEVDKAANAHTTKAPKHATSAWAKPAAGAA